MRLKRLELFGFKSFADRTVFEFGGDTLTGIVGPNGCGKSNVVDAMRWVLGEQRPTSMRGTEMTDVIFKGCASRPSMSIAEGSLVLDNSSGVVEDRGPEIAVTRRVYKSGEGEYLIDGQKVRLKDVREMLFGTGLGSRGYSVLEQGKIDAVLSANPIDRRRIFEEAAGVSRYRQRKHEVELKLARVEQDLARLEDVTGELRTRVRSLKIQAGKAQRYVEAHDAWETKKTRLVKHQLYGLRDELARCVRALAELESELERMRGDRHGSEESIQILEGKRGEVSCRLEEVSRQASGLEGDARALDERRKQLLARVRSWEVSAKDEADRATALAEQLAERGQELKILEEQESSLDTEAESARAIATRHTAERRELGKVHQEYRSRVEEQNERLLHQLHEKTASQNTLRHLESARGPAEERYTRVQDRFEEARDQLASVRAAEDRATEELAGAEEALVQHESTRQEAEGALAIVEREIEQAEVRRNRLEVEVARRTSRIESLLDRERELADLGEGARAVLEAVDADRGPCTAGELSGLLADHLQIGTEYARALDAVLGARSQALVARNASVARGLVTWLSGDARGQAALCVEGGLGTLRAASMPALPAGFESRVLGELRSHVTCDAGCAPIVDILCAGFSLVPDVDTALELVRIASYRRCVTPRGELVDAAGLIAGARTLAQGAVGRRSSAAELQEEVRELQVEEGGLERELETARRRREEARLRLRETTGEVAARKDALAMAQGHLRTSEARARDLAAGLELLEQESAGVIAEREKLATDLVDAKRRVEEVVAAFERENQVLQEMENRRRTLEAEREEGQRAEGRARIELTRVEAEIQGLSRRITDTRRVLEENEGEVERARRLSREASESARIGEEESHDLARRGGDLAVKRQEVERRASELRKNGARIDAELDELRATRDTVTRSLEQHSSRLSDLRLEQQRLELAREEISRRTEEELGLEIAGLLDGFEAEEELSGKAALDALDQEVRELKGQLERLGPVNVEAVDELKETGGRLEFMETQIGDLVRARRGLQDNLKKIEEESERLFVETFDEVRNNFQRVFRQLFGGGRADVTLAEGEPVLEAGVEISARPPGREMLPIGLLSGGQRTMTALALLFAVFEARPSPFCVLDEVDAALDDANIQRFLGMLGHFRRSTQFVIVTHNKGTMALCESLYGVTMQTKGVSRQVSVTLEEVDEFVPEATGGDQADPVEVAEVAEVVEPVEPVVAEAQEPVEESVVTEVHDELEEPVAAETSVEPPPEPSLDLESGEPIVEIVPAIVVASGEVEGGTPQRFEDAEAGDVEESTESKSQAGV